MKHDDTAAPVRSGRSQKESSNAGGSDRLKKFGLGECAKSYADNGIDDLAIVHHRTDQDLEKLGVLLGHRRKLLHAIGSPPAELTPASERPCSPRSVASSRVPKINSPGRDRLDMSTMLRKHRSPREAAKA